MSNGGPSELVGRRAVVTGAGRGIGRTIALALARAGADVAITARTSSELERLAAEIEGLGRRCVATTCDVTDAEQVENMAMTVSLAFENIDILVNNAGTASSHKFVDHPDELWQRMLAVNLTSVYLVSKAFVPMMIEQHWGRIINIASIASRTGGKYISAYTAAKHGVLGLTRALAVELTPHNITVNAICPGYVDTPLTDMSVHNIAARTGMSEEQARSSLTRGNPQGRLVEPEEVAAIALFLAQESSRSITGQGINIDGGALMS